MPLQPNARYDGTVIDSGLTQAETGTPALWFRIKTEDGTIDHNIWITPNTVKRAAETMQKCFGVTREQLQSQDWLDRMADNIHNAEVSITTIEEERQNGDMEVKVQWMNPRGVPKKPATPMTKQRIASLFGGKQEPLAPPSGGPPPFAPDDGSIPF